MSGATESGTIVLPPPVERKIHKALRDLTNMVHAAVLHEIEVLARGLGTSGRDLDSLAQRATDARERWEFQTTPAQKAMTNMLAVRAVEGHLEQCRSTTGRLKAIRASALAELLPRRNGKDRYFRVPDLHGDVAAGITIDDGELRWEATVTDHMPTGGPRALPLARVPFALLEQVRFPEGFGGEVVDGDGRVVLNYGTVPRRPGRTPTRRA